MQTVKHLTVLYDPTCGFCVRCRQWLDKQPKLVAMRFIPQGSSKQQTHYPDLQYVTDDKGRPEELIVIDDKGKVYRDDKAWVIAHSSPNAEYPAPTPTTMASTRRVRLLRRPTSKKCRTTIAIAWIAASRCRSRHSA